MDAVYKLGTALTLKDAITAPFERITSNAEKLKSKFDEIDGGMKKFENSMKSLKIGGGMLAAGAGMGFFTKSLIDANRETSQMQSNLKTLGLSDAGIQKITASAMKISSVYKTTRNEALDAAYDIKSAISSLDDEGVGILVGLVSKTAAATKGSTKQLASMFGTVYQQNKELYKNLNDFDFGNVIGNSFSFAVQTYKTEGSKMQQAIESVSGVASNAGYDIAEQFNVLGMLQNVMPSAEAGTGFRAFVQSAVEASQKLGMSFVDQKGKLLPVASILDMLKAKYGDTIEASEAVELKKAFGSDEAMKLINNLWTKTGDLKTNIETLRKMKGPDFLNQMSAAGIANIDTELASLGNNWSNMKSVFGEGAGWGLSPFINLLKSGLGLITEFATAHPSFAKVVGVIMLLGTTALSVGGALMTLRAVSALYTLSQIAAGGATGVSTFSLIAHKAAMIASAVGTKVAAAAQWLWNASLFGCPVVWIIGGIIALGAAIYGIVKYWDLIKEKASAAWNWIKNIWGGAPTWVKGLLVAMTAPISIPIMLITKFIGFMHGAGGKLITTFWEGIKEKAAWLKNNIKGVFENVWKLFSQSDAKEGPFSKLSYSGKMLIQTFNSGIETEGKRIPAVTPYFKNTMNTLAGQGNSPVAGGAQRGGLTISVANLIGTLTMGGQTKTGTVDDLARVMARAIHNELLRYGNG